jgi:hypothetical protein
LRAPTESARRASELYDLEGDQLRDRIGLVGETNGGASVRESGRHFFD